jgi:hypothetical protein
MRGLQHPALDAQAQGGVAHDLVVARQVQRPLPILVAAQQQGLALERGCGHD